MPDVTPAAPTAGQPAATDAPAGEEKVVAPGGTAPEKKEGEVVLPGGEKKTDEPAAPRTFKLKVDGQVVEVDEDELKKGYSLSRTAYQRLEQVATLRKQLEGFASELQRDPLSVMRQVGKGNPAFRESVEKWLYGEMQKEKMSPEQKELLAARERLSELEEKDKSWARQQQEAKAREQQDYWAKKYDQDITAAITDPTVGLPRTPAVISRMADLMGKALRAGLDVDPRDVALQVKKELLAAQRELIGKLDGPALMSTLGEETAKKIRAHEVAQLKRNQPKNPEVEVRAAPKVAEQKRTMTEREFDEYVQRMARGEAK